MQRDKIGMLFDAYHREIRLVDRTIVKLALVRCGSSLCLHTDQTGSAV
jgi:hypothetical protein